MMTKEELGKILKNRRKELGKNVIEVAASAGISCRTVYFVEKGKVGLNVNTLLSMLDSLNLHLEITKNEENN